MPSFRVMRTHFSPRISRWIFLVLLTGIILAIPATVFANVTLVEFIPSEEDGYVRLDWETASEIDTAGFYVLRSTTGGNLPGDYATIPLTDVETGETDPFVPPKGDLIGALYAYYDQNVTAGTTYYYFLQAVESTTDDSQYFGPYTITLSGGSPTVTPTATSTATPSPTPTATQTGATSVSPSATPTPSVTPTRTQTSLPSSTPRPSTPVPTSPPFNTVTPTRTNTPTPGPSPTFTLSPTVTPSPSVTLAPLDLTLTVVIAQVSPLPTYTLPPPTRTPFPTWTPTSSPTTVPVTPGVLDGVSSTGLFGLFLAGFLFLSGGGFITFFLFLSRKK